MKTKTLALISGLVGLIGGTILLLSNIFFVPFSALLGDSGLNLLGAVIKLAALGLGITSLAYYKGRPPYRRKQQHRAHSIYRLDCRHSPYHWRGSIPRFFFKILMRDQSIFRLFVSLKGRVKKFSSLFFLLKK